MKPGERVEAPPLAVGHAKLERLSQESAFKSVCPVCKEGALLVARDPTSFSLINLDRCTYCAQQYLYTDKTIAGAPVADVVQDNQN